MVLTFAFNWHKYDDDANFTYLMMCAIIRAALSDKIHGDALMTEINNGTMRVINGPHKSKDGRRHVTVHCIGLRRTYHLYISKAGNWSGSGWENAAYGKQIGHVNDDTTVPAIADFAALP